jgi:hypothetical protein
MVVAFCVPVAAGRSRLVWAFPRNFGVLSYKLTPRWLMPHDHAKVADAFSI